MKIVRQIGRHGANGSKGTLGSERSKTIEFSHLYLTVTHQIRETYKMRLIALAIWICGVYPGKPNQTKTLYKETQNIPYQRSMFTTQIGS
jgi:hypothetical protein